jgi:hypothetical protein
VRQHNEAEREGKGRGRGEVRRGHYRTSLTVERREGHPSSSQRTAAGGDSHRGVL